MSPQIKIPAMRPLLPTNDLIIPYLKEIDQSRWYSNYGPLVRRLEKRFEDFFGLAEGCVATISNGTAALTGTLRAMALPKKTRCIVPSWTFIATPAAVVASGLVPYFVDVDEGTWAISPEIVKKAVARSEEKVSAVIAVAPFGRPFNTKEWDEFTEETGIPVIIDAAAGFDTVSRIESCKAGRTPVMVSLHATKTLGMGEGGIVISKNKALLDEVRQMINFGFHGTNAIALAGTNGKMSEYGAAVGLAALDDWNNKRKLWAELGAKYKAKLDKLPVQHFFNDEWVTSTCSMRLKGIDADSAINIFAENGIEIRKWWRGGCHNFLAYSDFPRTSLDVTEQLVKSVIGIPFWIGIGEKDIDKVMGVLEEVASKVLEEV